VGLVGRNETVHGRVLLRHRLFRLLDETLASSNAWIAGMAGAGKTTLVASYLDARSVQAAWIEVESDDRDPGAFCQTLREAFGLLADQVSFAEAGASADLGSFARRFVRDLRNNVSPPATLVLDNCHEAQGAPEFRQLLGEIVRQGGSHMRLVMIGRARPPMEFARFIAHGTLVQIDDDELRLTEEESIELQQLEAKAPKPPSLERMRELHRMTQGWAAGVKLLLRRFEAQVVPPPAAAAPGGALFDYLAEEVFARQADSVRTFLMRAAFLPHVSPSAAASLSGSGNGELVLDALVREYLFTTRHTEGRSVRYTFHPLLRSFLLSHARANLPAVECNTWADTAADLLSTEGDSEAAARVLIEHERWVRLAAHVTDHAASLVSRGLHRTLAAWIAPIPQSVRDSQPYLSYWHGMALAPRDADQAIGCFEQAYRRFREDGDTTGATLAWCGAVETIAMEWSDFSVLDRWLAEAGGEQIMAADTSSPEVAARYTAAMFAALLWRRPDTPAVHEWAERLLEVIETCPEPNTRILLGCNLEIHYAVAVGMEPELDRLMRAVEPLPGVELGVVAATLLQAMRALYLMHRGRYEQAVEAARSGTALGREHGLRLWDFLLAAIEVYALLNGGELRRGREALVRLEKAATPKRRLEYSHYLFLSSLAELLRREGRRPPDADSTRQRTHLRRSPSAGIGAAG
jgi:ATP/maltotriose-dependent transcriptional regulator MalT